MRPGNLERGFSGPFPLPGPVWLDSLRLCHYQGML